MSAEKPKFVIIDQNLSGYNGHYWEYDTAVAGIFAARGHDVFILANQSAAQRALTTGDAVIHPWFSYTSADISRPEIYRKFRKRFGQLPGFILAPLRAIWRLIKQNKNAGTGVATISAFGRECADAIRHFGLKHSDALFIQTVHTAEFKALIDALKGVSPCPRLFIMLRREPEDPAMTGLGEALRDAGALKDRMVFLADTKALAEAYARQYSIPVREVPVICDLSLIRKYASAKQKGPARKIMYLGNARAEKGFHLLPGLLDDLELARPDFGTLEFHIQSSTTPDDDPDPQISAAIRELKRHTLVTLYPQHLSQEEYIKLLYKADIVLLPYDAALYQRRSSGILMQVLAAGKVAVIPEGTSFAQAVPPDAAQRFAPGDLTRGVLEALENFERSRAAAELYGATLEESALKTRFYAALENGGKLPN